MRPSLQNAERSVQVEFTDGRKPITVKLRRPLAKDIVRLRKSYTEFFQRARRAEDEAKKSKNQVPEGLYDACEDGTLACPVLLGCLGDEHSDWNQDDALNLFLFAKGGPFAEVFVVAHNLIGLSWYGGLAEVADKHGIKSHEGLEFDSENP